MIKYIDERNTYIDKNVIIGDGTTIYPNVFIEGNTRIGCNCFIGPGTFIRDCVIGDNTIIYSSQIFGSIIGSNNLIGPFANIRENNKIGNNNRLGSFVEFKNNIIGNNNKIPHLSFIGDAILENDIHIGCGSITVNKKALSKVGERETTIIKNSAFIGCNVNMLAPITIGEDSVVAAGSTVNQDVESNSLAIARSRQTNKLNYNGRQKI